PPFLRPTRRSPVREPSLRPPGLRAGNRLVPGCPARAGPPRARLATARARAEPPISVGLPAARRTECRGRRGYLLARRLRALPASWRRWVAERPVVPPFGEASRTQE